ncbi:MAG: RHS repeat-associated core domain-containing protein, partial [Planctomycetota bacterium]|nr:RHS repeat-associated core domain-containing protein [Planctomycetota bacterium]
DTGSPGIDLSNHDDYVRRSVYAWFDEADRQAAMADYGSGDTTGGDGSWKYASPPARGGSAPANSSSTVLLSKTTYDAVTGQAETTTDPLGTVTKVTRDDLYRTVKVEEDDGGAAERHTLTQYNGQGSVVKLIADMSKNDTISGGAWSDGGSDDQTTLYLYEDTIDASRQTTAIYPDSSDTDSTGTDQVTKEWNVDGTMKKSKGPGANSGARTILEYTYNGRRQVELEKATQLGTDIDNHIQSIKHEYDTLGREEKVTSYANSDGTGTVRNQVQRAYNQLSQVTQEWQSHEGVVSTGMSPSPSVSYGYDATVSSNVFTNGHRHKDTTYPSDRVIFKDYNTGGEINDLVHRPKKLRETDGSGTVLVEYSHNGAGGIPVVVDYQAPDIKLDFYQGATGTYAGLDRFGRKKDVYWDGYGSTSDVDRFKYSYNYDGSPKYRDIDAAIYATNTTDQAFTHDSLHRLATYDKGTLSGTTIGGTPAKEQDWTLDDLGNWGAYVEKAAGSTTLNQVRTNNKVNEITGISASTGDDWYDPTFDAAGNMRTGPKPGAPKDNDANGRKLRNTWDAWNRLVKAEVSPTNVSTWTNVITCEYDGLNRRIAKVDKTGMGDVTYDYYYDGHQIIETRKDADTDPLEQFVWHTYYIDALAVRYYDSDTDGSGIVAHYYTHDANFNVTAVTNSSGAVQERYEYSPYGAVTVLDADFSTDNDGLSDVGNGTNYTGRLLDPETGYYYYRARYYDPGLGGFVRRDPLGFDAGDSNLYRYVGNCPLMRLDPTGQVWWNPFTWFDVDWNETINDEAQLVRDLNKTFGTSHTHLGQFTQEERARIETELKKANKAGIVIDWDHGAYNEAQAGYQGRLNTLDASEKCLYVAAAADAAAGGLVVAELAGVTTIGSAPVLGTGAGTGAASTLSAGARDALARYGTRHAAMAALAQLHAIRDALPRGSEAYMKVTARMDQFEAAIIEAFGR